MKKTVPAPSNSAVKDGGGTVKSDKKDQGGGTAKRLDKKPRDDPEPPFKVTLPANMEPTYYIGGGNGVNL